MAGQRSKLVRQDPRHQSMFGSLAHSTTSNPSASNGALHRQGAMDDMQWGEDWNEEARRHPTLLIRRTLRSGQRVHFRGNVVVLGDINPGAEVVAGGDIVVMGCLRGIAHAGAQGDAGAIVNAFRLSATQLRIAQFIARAPDAGEPEVPQGPEYAQVRDGQLVIDRWQTNVLGNLPIRGI